MIRPSDEPFWDSRDSWCFGVTVTGQRKLFLGFTSKEAAARGLALQKRQIEKMAPIYTRDELKALGCDAKEPKGKIRRLTRGECEDEGLTMDDKIAYVRVTT